MLRRCYDILNRIMRDGAFSGQALHEELQKDATDAAAITRLVYGVIEQNATLNYIIGKLCTKSPQPTVFIILKLGIYQLRYTDTVSYAAVNNTVDLCKKVGKSGVSGFVNAVLKKATSIPLPSDNAVESVSIRTGKPAWYIRLLSNDYPKIWETLALSKVNTDTHIRVFDLSATELLRNCKKTAFGYYCNRDLLSKFNPSDYTVIGEGSCEIANAVGVQDHARILDACAAPGGKSVFMATAAKDVSVVARDIHPHRVKLIESYCKRLEIENVIAQCIDGTVQRAEDIDAYDCVLLDVPCSGTGVVGSKPDILLKDEPNWKSLSSIQNALLHTNAAYVRRGGYLIYSTCSLAKCENEKIVDAFLSAHDEFEAVNIETIPQGIRIGKYVQLLPESDGAEGFFLAKLRRKTDTTHESIEKDTL